MDIDEGRLNRLLGQMLADPSRFIGFDFHLGSLEQARAHAREHNITNASFEVGTAKEYPGTPGLVALFDCLNDMGAGGRRPAT
jgi:ubiquinone/menaquinone biosynthesis C-methylase UbiE